MEIKSKQTNEELRGNILRFSQYIAPAVLHLFPLAGMNEMQRRQAHSNGSLFDTYFTKNCVTNGVADYSFENLKKAYEKLKDLLTFEVEPKPNEQKLDWYSQRLREKSHSQTDAKAEVAQKEAQAKTQAEIDARSKLQAKIAWASAKTIIDRYAYDGSGGRVAHGTTTRHKSELMAIFDAAYKAAPNSPAAAHECAANITRRANQLYSGPQFG